MYPNLKLQLWAMGIRQNRLAQALGMDESVVSKIINGFRTPSPEARARIAALLASDAEWLFECPGGRENGGRENGGRENASRENAGGRPGSQPAGGPGGRA